MSFSGSNRLVRRSPLRRSKSDQQVNRIRARETVSSLSTLEEKYEEVFDDNSTEQTQKLKVPLNLIGRSHSLSISMDQPTLDKIPKYFSQSNSFKGMPSHPNLSSTNSLNKLTTSHHTSNNETSSEPSYNSDNAAAKSLTVTQKFVESDSDVALSVNTCERTPPVGSSECDVIEDNSESRKKGTVIGPVTDQIKVIGRFASNDGCTDDDNDDEKRSEELEAKFVLLTSEYQTDKQTLTQRVVQSQQLRQNLEQTLTNEINETLEIIRVLIPECSSTDREEIRDIQKRLEKVVPLAIKYGSKSETFGAVQQEHRLRENAETLVMYVDHLKRQHEVKLQEATRERLMQATAVNNDNQAVNVNITRRTSAYGGTQQVSQRRASVAMSSLFSHGIPGVNCKQIMDPTSKFREASRRISQTVSQSRQNSSDKLLANVPDSEYVELPAITVKQDQPDGAASNDGNNNSGDTLNVAQVIQTPGIAMIHTIKPVVATVETTVETDQLETPTMQPSYKIIRRRSIKRQGPPLRRIGSLSDNSPSPSTENKPFVKQKPSLLDNLHEELMKYEKYRSMHEQYKQIFNPLDKALPTWKRNLVLILLFFMFYICLKNNFGSVIVSLS